MFYYRKCNIMNSHTIMFILTFALLTGVSAYVYKVRKKIDEMHGMMAGMTLGMTAGCASEIAIPDLRLRK